MSDILSAGPHPSRSVPVPLLLSIMCLAIVVIVTVLSTARPIAPTAAQPPGAPTSATQPSTKPSPTPSSTPTPTAKPGPPCSKTVTAHDYTNDQDGHRFGPPLVGADLNPKVRPTAGQSKATTRAFWHRLCRDKLLAKATLATLDPAWDVTRPSSHDEVLQAIYNLGLWDKAQLWYGNMPAGSWTYYTVRGQSPELYAAPFPGEPSWYLVVVDDKDQVHEFRLKCGGQGVFDKNRLNDSIKRR